MPLTFQELVDVAKRPDEVGRERLESGALLLRNDLGSTTDRGTSGRLPPLMNQRPAGQPSLDSTPSTIAVG
jgi:hypothetical protein